MPQKKIFSFDARPRCRWRWCDGWGLRELKLFVVGYDFDGTVEFKTRNFVEAAIRENAIVVVSGSKTASLVCIHDFGKSIREFGLSATVSKFDVSNLYVTFNHVVSNVEVAYPAELVGVTSK